MLSRSYKLCNLFIAISIHSALHRVDTDLRPEWLDIDKKETKERRGQWDLRRDFKEVILGGSSANKEGGKG